MLGEGSDGMKLDDLPLEFNGLMGSPLGLTESWRPGTDGVLAVTIVLRVNFFAGWSSLLAGR